MADRARAATAEQLLNRRLGHSAHCRRLPVRISGFVALTLRLAPRSARFLRGRFVCAALVAGIALPAVCAMTEGGQRAVDDVRQPIQELMRTEVVYPQQKGELQLMLGCTADGGRHGSVLAFPLQAELGLTDAWQIDVEWRTYSRVRIGALRSSGRGALSAGTKYSFMDIGGSGIHAALGVEAEFPGGLGPDGASEDAFQLEPFAAVAVDLRGGAQVFFHTGRSFTPREPHADSVSPEFAVLPAEAQWNAGALVARPAMTLALELNARTSGAPWHRAAEVYGTPSITFPVSKSWEVGFGMAVGLNPRSDPLSLIAHVIYEK